MKEIHKQFLCLATSYLDMYVNENKLDKEVLELYEFVRKETFIKHNKKQEEIINNTHLISLKIEYALKGEEIEGNVLVLGLASLMVLIEDNVYKLSKGMKLKRLVNDIFDKVERNL